MDMARIPISLQGHKCFACISDYLSGQLAYAALVDKTGVEEPSRGSIRDADTMAPSWQQTVVHNQVVMACVALPVCIDHLGVTEETPLQKAVKAGLALPGQS